jgi:hypothetical protein
MGSGIDLCVARISTKGTVSAVTRVGTRHHNVKTMMRSLSRQARKQTNVQPYEIDNSFVVIEYDQKGSPRCASVSWLANGDVEEWEVLTLLTDVWRAARSAAAV